MLVQTLYLRTVVGQDVAVVAVFPAVDDVVRQHLEILVELRLRRRPERNRGGRGTLGQVVAQHRQTALRQIAEQLLARRKQPCHLLRFVALFERAFAQVVHAAQGVVGVVEPPCRIRTRETGERNEVALGAVDIGDDVYAFEPVGRQLVGDFEASDGFHLVVEEVETVRTALGV